MAICLIIISISLPLALISIIIANSYVSVDNDLASVFAVGGIILFSIGILSIGAMGIIDALNQ